MEKEFQVSSDDPLDIFGRSILGARWRTDAGVGLLFCGAASRACTYPCMVRRAGATLSVTSLVLFVQRGDEQFL